MQLDCDRTYTFVRNTTNMLAKKVHMQSFNLGVWLKLLVLVLRYTDTGSNILYIYMQEHQYMHAWLQLCITHCITPKNRYTVTPLHHYTITWLHHYTVTRLHLYTVTRLHRYTITRLHGYIVTPLHGYTVTPLHGYTVTLLHRYTATRLHRYTVTRLHQYTVTTVTPLQNVPQQNWSEVIVSYDNMCHLDSMRLHRIPCLYQSPMIGCGYL